MQNITIADNAKLSNGTIITSNTETNNSYYAY